MSDPDNHFEDEKLVTGNETERNWRGILIALLVITAVLALIVTSVVLLTPPEEGPRIKGRRLRLQDILGPDLVPIKHNATWISGDLLCMFSGTGEEFVYRDPWGGISLMHASNLSTKTLMPNTTFRTLNPSWFSLSADRRFLLLALNVRKVFRYSHLAQYAVYDTLTTESYPLTPLPTEGGGAAGGAGAGQGGPPLLLASWTPRGHGLVTVKDYDVFYRPAPRSSTGYRVTDTAVPGVVHNGVPDWLYEEEILSTNSALWMSADGHMMLYATFNDTFVKEQRYPWYGSLDGEDLTNPYPEIRSVRYPKPGTRNPIVTLTVADLADPKHIRSRHLTPPQAILNEGEYYFTSAQWVSLTEVCVVWLNRAQNLSVVSVCKSPMWYCLETYRIESDAHSWAETAPAPLWAPEGGAFVTLAAVRDGPAGLYRHAVRVQPAAGATRRAAHALTHGRSEVTKLLAWDHDNEHIYYLGVPESKPGQLHLYRVSSAVPSSAAAPQKLPYCVTCVGGGSGMLGWSKTTWDEEDWGEEDMAPTTPPPAKKKKKNKPKEDWPSQPKPCLYHAAHFSPTAAYFILECLGPGVPENSLYRTALPEPRMMLQMQNNTDVKEQISGIALPAVRTFAVQMSGGYAARVRLLLPPGLKEDEITRYPLVLIVYGAPGSQLVSEKWRLEWSTYVSAARGCVVAAVDARGSAGQGLHLVHAVYKRLGTVEVADQLEVTEYLRDSLHFVDPRRVAVWGWSYGGFVATHALASPLALFRCGIAVAPVVSWRLYDSAYAERYMGVPNVTGNYRGYAEADVRRHASRLRDRQLYLVHGAADDNVHAQHAMALARALADAGAIFRQQIYPDEGHSLSGVKKHLYRSMSAFLDDCFRKPSAAAAGEGRAAAAGAGLRNGGGDGSQE